MVCDKRLISFHILENDSGRNLLTWTYPTITEKLREFLLEKCFTTTTVVASKTTESNQFYCLRKLNYWIYVQQSSASASNNAKKYAIVVLANEFDPSKYKLFCEALTEKYLKCGNPVELVKLYLGVFTGGMNSGLQENGTACFLEKSPHYSNLKNSIRLFGKEVVLIYMAILLKRRVLVYGVDINVLQQQLGTLIHLVPETCRHPNEYMYPLVNTFKELKGLSFYVVGTTNSSLMKEDNLYDVAIDLRTHEISVSSRAEEIMAITRLHQEMAKFFVQLSESDWDEAACQQHILKKTSDIINQLKSLTSVTTENNIRMITINDLKLRKYSPAVENFLFNLAVAENIMIL